MEFTAKHSLGTLEITSPQTVLCKLKWGLEIQGDYLWVHDINTWCTVCVVVGLCSVLESPVRPLFK